jgi:regulator of protease activity HflC (stomatin/prohibitin superfamily)
MSGFAWLNELMTWLAKWVPRLVLVTSRHHALVFRPRDVVTEHRPGLLVYWPVIHSLQLVSMQLRTMKLSAQLKRQEVVEVVVSWTITAPKVALLSLNDVGATVENWTAASLESVYDDGLSSDELGERTADCLARKLQPHGVKVHAVQIGQRGAVFSLKNLSDWAPHHERVGLAGDLQS